MLFGVPKVRDAIGSGATDPDGILNVATRAVVAEVGDALVVQTDLCLDEFTDHGHCGVLDAAGAGRQRRTLLRYRDMALAQAEAGSQLLGPQRHDGRPGRGGARRARRARPRRHGDPRLRGEVCVRVLRPVPRSGASRRSTATAAPTSWTRRTGARALREVAARHRRRRRHRDGQARDELPRRARGRAAPSAMFRSGPTRCPGSTR